MNEEQKLKQKAGEMLDYFKTTYEKDLFAVRKGPPDVMQRRPHARLFTRMWGGSNSNMLHASNRQQPFEKTTTASLVGEAMQKHIQATRSRDILARVAKQAAKLPANVIS